MKKGEFIVWNRKSRSRSDSKIHKGEIGVAQPKGNIQHVKYEFCDPKGIISV